MKTPYTYESDDTNILLVQEKGNTRFQSIFSPFEHLVLAANFFHVKSKRWSTQTNEDYRNGFSTSLAVGYYYLFDQYRKQGGLFFDSYL